MYLSLLPSCRWKSSKEAPDPLPYHWLSSLGGSVISGIIAVFTSRYSQLRYTFLVPTSPQVCGLSFLTSVQSIGPGSHPKAGTPSPRQKAQARLRHLCSFSSYGSSKSKGVLTILPLPSSSTVSITLLYL